MFIRFLLFIKHTLMSLSFYVTVLFLLLGCFLVSFIEANIEAPFCAGVYFERFDDFEQCLMDSMSDVDTFIVYQDYELMIRDIKNTRLACGFVVKDNINDFDINKLSKYKVDYISTPNTNYGAACKEMFFDIFLTELNDTIIKEVYTDVFYDMTLDEVTKIIELKDEYLASDVLFSINLIPVNTYEMNEAKKVNLLRGLVAIVVFIGIYISGANLYDKQFCSLFGAFSYSRQVFLRLLYPMSSSILYMIVGLLCQFCFETSHHLVIDLFKMSLMCLYTIVSVFVLRCVIQDRKTYNTVLFVLLPLMVVICPVIIDISKIFGAFGVIKYVFPISIYL